MEEFLFDNLITQAEKKGKSALVLLDELKEGLLSNIKGANEYVRSVQFI